MLEREFFFNGLQYNYRITSGIRHVVRNVRMTLYIFINIYRSPSKYVSDGQNPECLEHEKS